MRIFIAINLFAVLGLAGDYADSFIESAQSPLVISMAGSNGAADTSVSGTINNPAAISKIEHINVECMYNRQFGLADAGYINCAYPISKNSTMAINWILFSVNNIIRRPDLFSDSSLSPEERRQQILSSSGLPKSTFSDLESATFLTFARHFNCQLFLPWSYDYLKMDCPIGINLKWIHKHLDDNLANGIGIDLGVKFSFLLSELMGNDFGRIFTGITLKDLGGTQIYWNSRHTDLIQQQIVISGAFYQKIALLKSQLTICGSWNTRYPDESCYGIEWSVMDKIHLRFGMNDKGWQTGCGIHFLWRNHTIQMDYGLLPHDLDNSHRISLGIVLK